MRLSHVVLKMGIVDYVLTFTHVISANFVRIYIHIPTAFIPLFYYFVIFCYVSSHVCTLIKFTTKIIRNSVITCTVLNSF